MSDKPIDTLKYPLVRQAYELCLAIEGLPASDQQTAISIKCSELQKEIWDLLESQQSPPQS